MWSLIYKLKDKVDLSTDLTLKKKNLCLKNKNTVSYATWHNKLNGLQFTSVIKRSSKE